MSSFFEKVITVYGRKPVLEALGDPQISCYRLHLSASNKPAKIIAEMEEIARQKNVEICFHSKLELSRISRKGSQDQGVALDILCPGFSSLEDFLRTDRDRQALRLIAADGITNPQNVGMLIRSAVAGGIDGILWPAAGNAALGPLAIKASAGTLFRAPLIRCKDLAAALIQCQQQGFRVYTLAADAPRSIYQQAATGDCIFVLGNESEGVSQAVQSVADESLHIPMHNGVESLNVAVTAALIAYLDR
jgi:23S rRNA (guanosine2251-2'-O)-methyltransferase